MRIIILKLHHLNFNIETVVTLILIKNTQFFNISIAPKRVLNTHAYEM